MKVDDPNVQKFIRQSMVARIATLSRSGRPSITPLYFNYVEGHIWLGTASWTLAAREVNADARVSILFQHERNPKDQRVLRVTGTALVRTDSETMKLSNRLMAFKYVLRPGGLLNRLLNLRLLEVLRRYRAQGAAKGPGCVIDVTPQAVEFLDGLPSSR